MMSTFQMNMSAMIGEGFGEIHFRKTFEGDDWQFFIPEKMFVQWPWVVVVPEKRGWASAIILDTSENFEMVGFLPDDQVSFNCTCLTCLMCLSCLT
jgi:hypothetical protein